MNQATLVQEWREAGVCKGDVLLIHSNIKRTLRRFLKQKVKITPTDILDSFLAAIGPTGTLLLPLYNFDFTQGTPFDIRNTKSQMGALTESGRLHPNAIRTGHPIYSFAVLGRRAHEFQNTNNNSGYGADSPFAMLREMDGRIAVLNLPDQNSMTFYHHVEEMHEIPYRYHKTFTGDYIDAAGATEKRSYGLFVRDFDKGVLTHVDPAGELMWEQGLYSGTRPNSECGLRTVSARKMYDFVSHIIKSDRAHGLLYRTESDPDE